MPQIPSQLQPPGEKGWDVKSLFQLLQQAWLRLAKVVNGNVSFGNGVQSDNISGVWISVTTPVTPNTDFTLTHNLGRVPVGYIPMTKSAACDVYTGSVAATTTQITLRATVGSVALEVFIL